MKHITPINPSGPDGSSIEPYCFGIDVCNFYDIAECPAIDWCYVDKESSCLLPADWCDPTDE